jgi:hypothetical protein
MKRRLKVWMKKRALMLLSAIVWRLDEWVHAQQLALQKEISGIARVSVVHSIARRAGSTPASRSTVRQPETFAAWTARRAGVAPASKQEARRRRTIADFDRRFA